MVKSLGKTLAALLVATAIATLAAPSAASQDATTLNITAHDDGGEYYFMVEGMDGKNPKITLTPGQSYTVNFKNEGPDICLLYTSDAADE